MIRMNFGNGLSTIYDYDAYTSQIQYRCGPERILQPKQFGHCQESREKDLISEVLGLFSRYTGTTTGYTSSIFRERMP